MKQLFIVVAAMCLFAACSKDKTTPNNNNNNGSPNQPSLNDNEKFLIGRWGMVKYIDSNFAHGSLVVVNDKTKPCHSDDVYTFNDNKKYRKEEGVDSCYDAGPYTEQDWSIENGSLNYKHGGDTWAYGGTFIKVDANNFIVHSTYHYGVTNYGSKTLYYKRK